MPLEDYTPAAINAVEAAILAAWPETTPAGVWELLEAERVAVENLGLPRSHIDLPVAEPWNDGPMTAVAYEQAVLAYYIDRTSGGASEPFRSKLKALQDQLLTEGLVDPETGTEFTVLQDRFRMDVHASFRDGEIQRILLIRNNAMQAGALAFSFLMGDYPHDGV